jgi:excinuclease ABC subunit C
VVIDGGRGRSPPRSSPSSASTARRRRSSASRRKEETVIFPDARAPLNLPLDHPGLRLLQRLRDEAHRFANTYNADLR